MTSPPPPRPLLRVPVSSLTEGEGPLPEQAARYAIRVHRLGPGDRFVVFDPDAQLEADAELLETESSGRRGKAAVRALVRIGPARPPSLKAARDVTLVQALAKGAKMDAVVRDATELGVARIVVATCHHSVRRGAERADAARRWRRIAVEAARQCGRGDAPVVTAAQPLATVLKDHSPSSTRSLGLCMDPTGDEPLGALLPLLEPEEPLVVVVGPEGGLSVDELELARKMGYRIARLGPFVMRTETVCAAVLGAVLARA